MKSLRSRLLWVLSSAIVTLTIAQSAVVFFSALHEADELFDHHLEQVALSLRGGRFDAVTAGLRKQPADEQEFEFVIRVRSPGEERVYESGPHPPFPDESPAGFSNIGTGMDAWRLYSIQSDGRTIEVGQALSLRRSLAFDFALNSVAPAFVILPLYLLFVTGTVRRALAPLATVTAELEQRTGDRMDPIETSNVLPEMLPMVRSMNSLLGRIRASFELQRAFVADAAHELRSPLTALKLQAQLLGRVEEGESRRAAQASLEEGIDRSVRLAEQLLALAREEGLPTEPDPEPRSVNDAVKLALGDVAALAAALAVDIGFMAPPGADARVRANPDAIRLLAKNLLENAIRHAPSGSRVDAEIAHDGGNVVLSIDDAGPGIPAEERVRVFDRFFRGVNAAPGGSGLGLAIVKAIALRCHAQVHLGTSPGGGVRASVRFPATADSHTNTSARTP